VHLFSTQQIINLNKAKTEEDRPRLIEEGSVDDEETGKDIIDNPVLASYLKERSVFVRGAIRNPGPWPVSEGATLDSVMAVAGGMTLEANPSGIEITSALQQGSGDGGTRRARINLAETSPEEIMLEAGDAVRIGQKFNKVEDKSVLIIGEVQNPGRYDLLPGDKLSDLLDRAGGLTNQAYPDGAIFSRENERKAEESRFRTQAREMKLAIATALEADDEKIDTNKIAEARALAAELEAAQGIGRITVEADPAVLKVEPELDMLLESGDRLYIPKRNLTVRVSGEVLSSAALQFRESKDPRDYIDEAGGFTYNADKDRTFVLYPDGSAQPLQVSAWNHKSSFIPPGSTIVVPRDPKPFDFMESAKDVSQILSNLAITAIFIDDVRDDD
jgi:protein involved in polysaccharide export with SLBB domain